MSQPLQFPADPGRLSTGFQRDPPRLSREVRFQGTNLVAEAALFQSESNALQQRLSVQLAALRVAKAVGAFELDGGSK